MARAAKYNCVARSDVKVRLEPHTNNVSSEKFLKGESFQISDIVPDQLDPANTGKKWGWIIGGKYDGKYTALEYPNNISPISTYMLIEGEPTPESPPDETPINEFREVGLAQRFFKRGDENFLAIEVTEPNGINVEVIVNGVAWHRPG